jgi:hypothetical protein
MSAGNESDAYPSDGGSASDDNATGDRNSDGKIDSSVPPVENSKADVEINKEGERNVKELSVIIIVKTRTSIRSRKENEVMTAEFANKVASCMCASAGVFFFVALNGW